MTEATELKPNQWRKKPVVITAVQLNTIEDARAYHPPVCQGGLTCKSKGAPDGAWPHIHTLEGDHTWREGDWCITGVNGEHYFCKPDIFAKTYEPTLTQAGASLTAAQKAGPVGKYQLGDRVTKTKGSRWTGLVVGFYSTSLTPIGYAVESETERGSVQIYPESALAIAQAQELE